MYGVSKMESEYDPVIYMDARSYQRRYFNSLETYFPEAGERVEIYIGNLKCMIIYNSHLNKPKSQFIIITALCYLLAGNIEYWKFDNQLEEVHDVISANPSIRNNSLNYWYTPFHDSCCREENNIIATNSSKFRCTTGNLYLFHFSTKQNTKLYC